MAGNPYLDLNWWAEFIVSDETCKDEMLTRAMCSIKSLPFTEYEALAKLFMDLPECRSRSGYGGPFDERYLYPLHIRISTAQTVCSNCQSSSVPFLPNTWKYASR